MQHHFVCARARLHPHSPMPLHLQFIAVSNTPTTSEMNSITCYNIKAPNDEQNNPKRLINYRQLTGTINWIMLAHPTPSSCRVRHLFVCARFLSSFVFRVRCDRYRAEAYNSTGSTVTGNTQTQCYWYYHLARGKFYAKLKLLIRINLSVRQHVKGGGAIIKVITIHVILIAPLLLEIYIYISCTCTSLINIKFINSNDNKWIINNRKSYLWMGTRTISA